MFQVTYIYAVIVCRKELMFMNKRSDKLKRNFKNYRNKKLCT